MIHLQSSSSDRYKRVSIRLLSYLGQGGLLHLASEVESHEVLVFGAKVLAIRGHGLRHPAPYAT